MTENKMQAYDMAILNLMRKHPECRTFESILQRAKDGKYLEPKDVIKSSVDKIMTTIEAEYNNEKGVSDVVDREIEITELKEKIKNAEKRLNNIRKYGYPHCSDEFIPHLTLTRLKNEAEAHRAILLLPKGRVECFTREAAICILGPDGTCNQILQAFPLGFLGSNDK